MQPKLMQDYESTTGSNYTDSLTGLYNHGFFQLCLDQELRRSKRYGDCFTLALIDVDSFADYNTSKGPANGDFFLKQLAKTITANVRQVDLIARYSGDVFAVIMPKCEAKSASLAAERVRQAVEDLFKDETTVSIGLGSCPDDATNKRLLFSKAQEALLHAKIRGKNRVFFFEKQVDPPDDTKPKILIVDDDQRNLKLLEAMLVPLNYQVIKASNGEQALSIVNKLKCDLILLDIMMPKIDGFEVCRRLKEAEATRLIPVVMVTSLDDIDAKIKAIEAGADDFLTKPPNKTELLVRTRSLVRINRLNKNLTSIENVVFSLANTVEANDPYTQGHVERVSTMAVSLGHKMGLSKKELDALRLGGALHDIGKIAVPSAILSKPGLLTPEERAIMKNHSHIGYKICMPLKNCLGLALDVIRYHHEKLDGSGYPDGLQGNDIPTVARIMSVVDMYDALVTDRPYRKAMTKEKAIAILLEEAGNGKVDGRIIALLDELIQARTP